ncbi:MAG TPA: hypothetical protein VI959_02875, partial [Alphaproteobacteria bacterium]|nr:hypothetical protein [Alphaproteobacteria bacterium]
MTNIATFENEAILKHKIVMVFKKNGPLLRKEVASHLGVKGLEPRRELKAFLTHLVAIGLLKKEKSKRLNLCEGNCPSLEKHYPAADILKTFEHLSGNSLKIGVFQKLNKSITALHRKNDRFKYKIPDQFCKDFEQDDVVVCVFEGQKLDHVERLGNVHDQRLFPSLGVLNAGLAFSFSKEAIEDAKKIATVPNPSKNRK